MKNFKIDKKIEQDVEIMVTLAGQARALKEKHPKCWALIMEQFDLTFGYHSCERIPDDVENFKMNLYVEIVKGGNLKISKKTSKLSKKLNK